MIVTTKNSSTSLPNPGAVALRAVTEAEANVGVTEQGAENHGKYVETYLASVGLGAGAPWCAAFQYFRFSDAAKDLGAKLPDGFPKSGYCPDFENWGKKKGLWIPVADAKANPSLIKRGDLILFYFVAKGRVAHIGIVTGSYTDATGSVIGVYTVEGNTSSDTGVNRDGDGVFKKKRSFASLGAKGGFVRVPAGVEK